ncbi:hypothetical protein [Microcoleus sp.]|uniref:hypothetical protein n=1 Tax=Microcoleus sp. TaxID=44472 RepID=UPI0035942BC4
MSISVSIANLESKFCLAAGAIPDGIATLYDLLAILLDFTLWRGDRNCLLHP